MTQRRVLSVVRTLWTAAVVMCGVLFMPQESEAIVCTALPANINQLPIAQKNQLIAANTLCRNKQAACIAACRAVSACTKGCTSDFELLPGEFLVEVVASVTSPLRGVPSPSPTNTSSSTFSGPSFSDQQNDAMSRLLSALMSLGIGTIQSDATPKPPADIRGFDTTPWVFIVGNMADEDAKELAKRPEILSVSQMVKPLLTVSTAGDVGTPGKNNVTIHPKQIQLENDGTARVREPNGDSYVARADVDIDALAGWGKEPRMGEGAIIAVVDDGFDLGNSNLVGNIALNSKEIPCNRIDDDGNGYVDDYSGWNSVTKTGCSSEVNGKSGHGTHVAGIAAATARANNDRLTGTAPFSKFLPVKASQDERVDGDTIVSTFSSDSLVEAYRFVLARVKRGDNIKVLNLSLSIPCEAVTAVEKALLNQLAKAGVSIVVAAGNAANNTDVTSFCPASLDIPGLISVANVAPSGKLHLTSNFGAQSITTSAPGTVVYGVNDKLMTGTSMAAPFVSGVVALMYAAQPLLTPNDVRTILLQTGKRIGGASIPVRSGGLVSAPRAVQSAREWKVFGTVVEARTERPLADVFVSMSSPSTGMVGVSTDGKGRFALPRPRDGEAVNLSFFKNGYTFIGNMYNPNSSAGKTEREVLKFSIIGAPRLIADNRKKDD